MYGFEIGNGRYVWNSESLKYDSETSPGTPDGPATLPGPAEQQLEPVGQLYLSRYLKACAAGRIVDNPAIDDGRFRVNDQLGQIGISARRPHTCKSPLMHCFSCLLPLDPKFFRVCIKPDQRGPTAYPDQAILVRGFVVRQVQQERPVRHSK
jgi:hypothetical protein